MPEFYRNAVIVMTVAFAFATALFIWMARQPERVERAYSMVAGIVLPKRIRGKADGLYERFMLGLRSLSSPSDITAIFFTSVLIWLLETVKYWFVMHAFDFSVDFVVLMLMNGLVNLATTLPAAPGYIGTFDTPGIMTLTTFGVNPSVAASYTFTLHAALWVPVTLLGGFFFWRNHLNMSDIETARRQQAQEEAAIEAELQHKEAETHLPGEDLPAAKQTPAGGAPVAPGEVRAI
jgi:uncharacterized protein (TIRG00374 family)